MKYVLAVLAVLGCAAMVCCTQRGQERAVSAPALSIRERIGGRTFPSVFQAWSPADNLRGEDALTTLARHDLVFHGVEFLHVQWNDAHRGLATGFVPRSVAAGREMRATLLEKNPHMVLLAEIRYRDAPRGYLPDGHQWWKYDQHGKPVMGWAEGGFVQLDFASAGFQKQVALQAKAATESGVFDGVMLDWWQDDDARLSLIRAVRAAIGDHALILVNANERTTPRTAPYINGYYMECDRSATAADWRRIGETLQWAETHVREPRVNCVETWFQHSRGDLNLMRATTTLALTMSDGYCLFCDPDPLPTPDHLHDWYPFWTKTLGKPCGTGQQHADGTFWREFTGGTAVYNAMGNRAATVTFNEERTSVATGKLGREHQVEAADGDLFIHAMPAR